MGAARREATAVQSSSAQAQRIESPNQTTARHMYWRKANNTPQIIEALILDSLKAIRSLVEK